MARHTRTGFDKFFDGQIKSPTLAKSYVEARTEVDAIDKLVHALDAAREASGLTKADLAVALETRPEVVRRLFTTKHPNPTLSTLIRLAATLGYRVELVRNAAPRRVAKRRRVAA
jgi:ribosome-binding protein aMBF1 (putative translation factor)